MKYTKQCKCCGNTFETNSPQKIYCKGPHYLPCPVCGKPVLKTDNDFSRPHKCCSTECAHKMRVKNIPKRICIFCGEEFQPKSGVALVCDKEHFQECEICGKQIPLKIGSSKTTCSEECTQVKMTRMNRKKYGCDHPMQNKEVQARFKQSMKERYGVEHALQDRILLNCQQHSAYETNMKNNGVPYACMLPQCTAAQGKIVSSANVKFAKRLRDQGIECSFEKRIADKSYDICIEDQKILIEIDPTYTHSSIPNHWGTSRDRQYHKIKSELASQHGYRCIHVFDWDDIEKVIQLTTPRRKIYARNCDVWKLYPKVGDEFLNKYHLQNSCRGQLLYLGLADKNELVAVMTFGKSRYDKSHDVELLRLCTRPDIQVVGGASKLFSYATSEYGLYNIISYCDLAKFDGQVYEKIGMQLIRNTPPQEIWSKGSRKITANLLRQRGFDQLFHTNHGKGVSNDQLMLEDGWLPIYDCGQAVYSFK